MARHIAHLDIPDFHATLEELRRPELRRYPLALAQPGPRAVVQGVNGIARTEGIHEGMALNYVQRLCRKLLTIPPDIPFYRKQHQRILQELNGFSPLVEGTWLGHYFVDMTGTQRLLGPPPDVACRIDKQLSRVMGMHARLGLASNKVVSQVAANCITPGDLSCIFPGGEASFLTSLPVTFLPGVGPKTTARLSDFNITQIGQLAGMPAEAISGVFGSMGIRLLRIAQGVDTDPVIPFRNIPCLTVERILERDEIDRERLEAILFQQAEEAGWMLRRYNRHPRCLALEIRYADGITVRGRYRLPPSAADVDYQLFKAILAAFDHIVKRRIAIRRMALELSEFAMPFRQMSLFPWEDGNHKIGRNLQKALDDIRHRFGHEAVAWGRTSLAVGLKGKNALQQIAK